MNELNSKLEIAEEWTSKYTWKNYPDGSTQKRKYEKQRYGGQNKF